MGNWHHPRIGLNNKGKATFLPNIEYARLLEDLNFRVWYEHYGGKSSRASANITVYRLMEAGDLASPTEFLELGVPEAKMIIRRVVNQLLSKGYTQGARIAQIFGSGFYNYCNEDLREIRWKRTDRVMIKPKKVFLEASLYNSDIYRMADSALGLGYKDNTKNKLIGLRNRAIILCLWQSGVRKNALLRWTYGMVKDYLMGDVDFEFLQRNFAYCDIDHWIGEGVKMSELPPVFLKITHDIDTKLGAYGLGYYVTFLQKEAVKALKVWLDARREATGRKLKDEDYLFTTYDMEESNISDRPIKGGMVLNAVKTCAGRAGLRRSGVWVHVLRKAFRKVLNRNFEMDDDTREALMGHKLAGSRQNYFDVHDIVSIALKYNRSDFSKSTSSQLNNLQKKLGAQDLSIQELKTKNEELRTRLQILEDAEKERRRFLGLDKLTTPEISSAEEALKQAYEKVLEEAKRNPERHPWYKADKSQR